MTDRFQPGFLDLIRTRIQVSEIVGKHVVLKRKGQEFVGLCPFHNEKTPSFTVNDKKQFYHCFGCGAHGDVIGFVMRHDNQSFPNSVRHLAGLAGLSAANEPDPEKVRQAERVRQARKQQDIARAAKSAQAAAEGARATIELCDMKPHPYLATKGFAELPALVSPTDRLVVPVWNIKSEIRSAQYIDEDSEKRFHPGGQIKGNFHRIGRFREVWLCEGYATGLSIYHALRLRSIPAEVRVCFSAGNLETVGIAAQDSGKIIYAVADHDWWRCKNLHKWDHPFTAQPVSCPECGLPGTPPAGEKSVAVLKRPYWLPPHPGQDANDYHLEHGLDSLATALREFRHINPQHGES